MKIQILRETLLKPLQIAIGVVEKKQAMPILSNILLSIKNNQLFITGTDSEIELIGKTQLENKTGDLNGLTIPGRKLADICKALPDSSPIELSTNSSGKVTLRSGRSRFTLSTLPATDFPNIETPVNQINFSTTQKDFKHLLHRTFFAMAHQDVRYYLNGMLLEVFPEKIQAVATDGHRLASNSIEVKTSVDHRVQIIIPRKGITELLRLLADTDEEIDIAISNNHIKVTNKDFTFLSKLVEGRFPDYDRVIPKSGNKFVVIQRNSLKEALSRSAILCNEKFKAIRLELRSNNMRILANNPEQESAEEEINLIYDKGELDIGFNVSYLLDILNTITGDEIKLTFSDADSSVLVEEPDCKFDGIFVVMPMRL